MKRAELAPFKKRPIIKCHAHSKRTGEPCNNYAMKGQEVCRMHGGSQKRARKNAAARIEASLDRAAAAVVKLMEDDATPHAVKLAAAKDLLDRGGLTGAAQVTAEPAPWQVLINKIIVNESGESQPVVIPGEVERG